VFPSGRLLDLTRTVSRLGQGPLTGIDRVEAAYLARLVPDAAPLWGLVRTAAGFLLLDRAGCAGVLQLLRGEVSLGDADLLGRLTRRSRSELARAEAMVRRLAIGRTWRPGLRQLLGRLPVGTSYLNLGHANLTWRTMAAARGAGLRPVVFLHDTIPLDHPRLCRPGTAARFAHKLKAAAQADLVIHSAAATRVQTEAHLRAAGRVPPGVVAPIGIALADPADAEIAQPERPYFVSLGTIEPRKNHAFLLDLWRRLPAAGRPRLLILGRRGWADGALFARIAAAADVEERGGLSDTAVAHLLLGARALLFPSLAEGYGLPVLEAAALGTPVICPPHPVFQELLGADAVYLPHSDTYAWEEAVMRLTRAAERRPTRAVPAWEDHFKAVLTMV
jgi:glycosyltransferase involved in cell wall biosynthesis